MKPEDAGPAQALYPMDDESFLIDLLYLDTPEGIGAYLLLDQHPALVEVGPTPNLPRLLEGIRAAGLEPEAIEYVFLTHIHLDHAGGAGVLARSMPRARFLVHGVGAPHLADPSRLLRSAGRLYGDAMDRLYGEVAPLPVERLQVLEDGEEIRLGRRRLIAVETPGHARHHHAYWEPDRRWLFTGDVAGIALPGVPYAHPPTPPPDIDLEAWETSIDRLLALKPRRLLYTHFGWQDAVEERLEQLRRHLRAEAELVRRGLAGGLDQEAIVRRYQDHVEPQLRAVAPPEKADHYRLTINSTMNVLGWMRYWEKRGVQADGTGP